MSVPVAKIEEVAGADPWLRGHLRTLSLYDEREDAVTSDVVAWALMYPSAQATNVLARLLR